MRKILLVDDDRNILTTFKMRFASNGYEVETAIDGRTALNKCLSFGPDLVLLDLRMPTMDGLKVLEAIKQEFPWVEVIIMTAQGSIETAVGAIREGAYYYIEKPLDMPRLKELIDNALEKKGDVGRHICEDGKFGRLTGNSPAMKAVYRQVEKVAATNLTVMITGESGTGKELAARTIHEMSPRNRRPFVAVNCAAIPDSMLESELFGHERGAFTSAHALRIGKMEQAHTGTLFFDEVGDMDLKLQAKILRATQDHEFQRVGGRRDIAVDVRLLVATNRNLHEDVANGRFREDLYHRLHVFPIHMPPLRERREDIDLLSSELIILCSKEMGIKPKKIHAETLSMLQSHDWPGNIRELKNVIRRALLIEDTDEIRPPSIMIVGGEAPRISPSLTSEAGTLQDIERKSIIDALEKSDWVQKDAARLLGITPRVMHYKIQSFNITHPRWKKNR